MTTIAYKGGIIAADTGLTAGGMRDAHMSKIAKNKAGELVGGAGDAWWIVDFLEWFKAGATGHAPAIMDDSSSQAISISRRGKITCYESGNGRTRAFIIRARYHSLGSGRRIATGAMFVGAHPADAVRAAIAHDDGTHGRVETLRLGK